MAFEKYYKDIPDNLKIQYLDTIIAHNVKLQKEFMAYVKDHDANIENHSYNEFRALVDEVQEIYQTDIELVDTLNPDWNNYMPSHGGYIEEWEQYQEASEQEFQRIFQTFLAEALDKIISLRPDELLAMLAGLYEAVLDANVPDESGSFDDLNEFLLSEHKQIMASIVEKLRLSSLSDSKTGMAFELFFRYCNEEYPGNPHFGTHFEPVLLALAKKTSDSLRVLAMMEKVGIERNVFPELSLLLLKSCGNQDEWLLTARKMYTRSMAVAKELLKHYFENDQAAFINMAQELFPANASEWARFLQDYVTPGLHKPLFVKVFFKLLIQEHNISHYQRIKPYIDEATHQRIISELRWNKVFLVKIFAEDENYAAIRALLEKENNQWHFDELITPILSIYPEFCFAKIRDMVKTSLEGKRGRSVYQLIAHWLLLAKQIPGHGHDAMQLIIKTYHHKPRLPALRDEMRQAGIKL